ncbi:MAG: tRNA (adenosine(37)-N6)-threonylcarbamoyltransferase complex ATPase subunit type 1 TsaE [Clostridia bacterium]
MKFLSDSVGQTYNIACLVAAHLQGGEIIILNGELGVGKTTFTKGLAKALGIKKSVVSPTFTIMREYKGKYKLSHIDMYRLGEDEADYLGLEESFTKDSVTVIEWNKLKNLQGKVITINIDYYGDDMRMFRIEGLK